MSITLTVFFDDPFWIGFLERTEDGQLSVAKTVYGAEPSDQQVYAWVLADFYRVRYSPPVDGAHAPRIATNPKRRQRQAAQSLTKGIGTKAQQAIQLAREDAKQERKAKTKQQRELEEERKYDLRLEKKKAKHRGH